MVPRRPPAERSPARRAFTLFTGSVLALHTVAIILWAVLGIGRRAPVVQNGFAGVWAAITIVLIVVGVRRVRAARYGGS